MQSSIDTKSQYFICGIALINIEVQNGLKIENILELASSILDCKPEIESAKQINFFPKNPVYLNTQNVDGFKFDTWQLRIKFDALILEELQKDYNKINQIAEKTRVNWKNSLIEKGQNIPEEIFKFEFDKYNCNMMLLPHINH